MWFLLELSTVVLSFVQTIVCMNSSLEVHYSNFTKWNNLVCQDDIRTSHASVPSMLMCSTICTQEPGCQNLVYERQSEACYTCQLFAPQYSRVVPLPNGEFRRMTTCRPSLMLINGPYGVPDSAITATSTFGSIKPSHIRITEGGWVTREKNIGEYVQIAFPTGRIVTSVCLAGVMGTINATYYVKKYRFLYSSDCDTFDFVRDHDGQPVDFTGNEDVDNAVCSQLTPLLKAACVRIYPIEFRKFMAMRVEIFGCYI